MTISEKVFNNYLAGGLLTRAEDGVHPITLSELKKSIGNLVLSKADIPPNSDKVINFGDLLPTNGPTYSASLLGQHKYPVLWYFYKYSDPFSPTELPQLEKRTTLVAILKPDHIFVHGMCLWDADSNDRNTGLIPNNTTTNKTTATNDFASRKVFDGIGNYTYEGTHSLNNFSWYNPLIRPETSSSIAKEVDEISPFLSEAGHLKEFWVSHLKNEAGDFNDKWAHYITKTYGSGVESEVLTTPKYKSDVIFGKLKYSINDIEAMAFVTDGLKHDAHSVADYENFVKAFFANQSGWLNPPTDDEVAKIPIISIKRVALPNVNLDSSTSSNVGKNWLAYFDNKGDTYQSPLVADDFKTIRAGNLSG